MSLSSWTGLNSVSVQTLMEGEATLIVTVGKSCRREGPGRLLLEILLGLFQIEFHSVEMLKDRLITYKLEMME